MVRGRLVPPLTAVNKRLNICNLFSPFDETLTDINVLSMLRQMSPCHGHFTPFDFPDHLINLSIYV